MESSLRRRHTERQSVQPSDQTTILPTPKCEFGLQEQIIPCHDSIGDYCGNRVAHRGLVIVAALIGGIDAPNTTVDRQLGKILRLIFFPRSPINDAGYVDR